MANISVKSFDEKAGRYKFLTLKERLDRVNVRPAAQSAVITGGTDDDTSWTHFKETLDRWRELDLSSGYRIFFRSVQPLSLSLPVLYFNRKKVLKRLCDEIRSPGTKSIPALCELVAALARDLGAAEFMPSFGDVVATFSAVLHAPNDGTRESVFWDPTKVVRPVFDAVGRVSRLFARWMIKNAKGAFESLSLLLNSEDERLRLLTAESSIGYLLRKCRDREEISPVLELVFQSAAATLCIFEGMRGAKSQLTFIAPTLLEVALDISAENLDRFSILWNAMSKLAEHVQSKTDAAPITEVLVASTTLALNSVRDHPSMSPGALPPRLFLVRQWLSYRAGKLVTMEESDIFVKHLVQYVREYEGSSLEPAIYVVEALGTLLRWHVAMYLLCARTVSAAVAEQRISWKLGYRFVYLTREFMPVEPLVGVALECAKLHSNAFAGEATAINEKRDGQPWRAPIHILRSILQERSDTDSTVSKSSIEWTSIVQKAIQSGDQEQLKSALEVCCFVTLSNGLELLSKAVDHRGSTDLKALSLKAMARQGHSDDEKLCKSALKLLRSAPSNSNVLEACICFNVSKFIEAEDVLNLVYLNMLNDDRGVLLSTLRLLMNTYEGDRKILFELCYEVETSEMGPAAIDNTKHLVSRLQMLVDRGLDPREVEFLACFSLATMKSRFTPPWKEASSLWCKCYTKLAEESWRHMETLLNKSLQSKLNSGQLSVHGHGAENAENHGIDVTSTKADSSSTPFRKRKTMVDVPSEPKKMKREQKEAAPLLVEFQVLGTQIETIAYWKTVEQEAEDGTEALALHLQLLKTLDGDGTALKDHSRHFLREVFLRTSVRGDFIARSTADKLLLAQVRLVEKLGGLRVCKQYEMEDPGLEQEIRDSILRTIKRTPAELQTAAVRALLASRSHLDSAKGLLLSLCGDQSFRESITLLSSSFAELVNGSEVFRSELIQVLVRILFGKVNQKKEAQKQRRKVCLRFMAENFLPGDIASYMELGLEPVASQGDEFVAKLSTLAASGNRALGFDIDGSVAVMMGVLNSTFGVVQELGVYLDEVLWDRVANTVGLICTFAYERSCENEQHNPYRKDLRTQSIKAMAEILRKNPRAGAPGLVDHLLGITEDGVRRLQVSGERAPALLLLLSSMSEDPKLLQESILKRPFAARSVFALLESDTTNPESASKVLDFCLRVLSLRDEDSANYFKEVINGLTSFLEKRAKDLGEAKALNKWLPSITLAIEGVGELCTRIEEPELAGQLLKSLVPFISIVGRNERISDKEISILNQAVVSVGKLLLKLDCNYEAEKSVILSKFSMMFSREWIEKSKITDDHLCEVFRRFSRDDLKAIADILQAMSAVEELLDESADYGKRLGAYNAVINSLKDSEGLGIDLDGVRIGEDALMPILHRCALGSVSDDPTTRGTAGLLLSTFGQKYCGTGAEGRHIVSQLIDLLQEKSLRMKTTDQRREPVRVLGEVVRSPMIADLRENGYQPLETNGMRLENQIKFAMSLSPLARSDDPEVDFFENAAHIQRYRRARSIRRAMEFVNDGSIPGQIGIKYLHPLALRMTFEDDATRRELPGQRDNDNEIANACASLAGAVAKKLSWTSYRAAVTKVIRMMKSAADDPKKAATISQVLVSMLDGYHFEAYTPVHDEPSEGNDDDNLENSQPGEKPLASKATPVGTYLTDNLIPSLLSEIIVEERGGGVEFLNAPMASAIAHLMAKLKASEMEPILPTLISPLSSAFRSRLNNVRDSARNALGKSALALGTRYLSYILGEMKTTLDEGFRRHVLTYSVHYILNNVHQELSSSSWMDSDVVKLAGGIFLDELLGQIAEQRDAKTSSTAFKEAKTSKGYDAFEIITCSMDFDVGAPIVFTACKDRLEKATSSRVVHILEEILHRCVVGMASNPEMKIESAFRFIYKVLEEFVPRCEVDPGKKLGKGKGQTTDRDEKEILGQKVEATAMVRNAHVLVEFALKLLSQLHVKGRFTESEENLSMLEPIIKMLPGSLETKYDSLTHTALRTAQRFMRMDLESREEVAETVLTTAVRVVARHGLRHSTAGEDLYQSSLRACTAVLSELKKEEESRDYAERKIKALLGIAISSFETDSMECKTASIAFIRAVINRRVQLPEVYDAADLIASNAIKAHSSVIRTQGIALSMSFLLNYPLSNRRLKQHVNFFITNLSYEHPEGRQSAINAVKGVIEKFPQSYIEKELQFLMVPISAHLCDDDKQCRGSARAALVALLGRLDAHSKEASLVGTMIRKWINSPSAELRRTGTGALAAAAEVDALPVNILGELITLVCQSLDHVRDEDWEEAYSALYAIEKVVTSGVGRPLACSEEAVLVWKLVCGNVEEDGWLLHPHGWIRLISSRLLGHHLARVGTPEEAIARPANTVFSAPNDGIVREVLRTLCSQLEVAQLSLKLAEQAVKNILYLSSVVRLSPELGAKKAEASVPKSTPAENSEEHSPEAEDTEPGLNRGWRWLIRRLCGLSSRAGDASSLRRASGMKLITSIVKSCERSDLAGLEIPLVSIVFQVTEAHPVPETGFPGDDADAVAAMPQITEDLKGALIEKLGASEFFELSSSVRDRHSLRKVERKRKQKMLAVSNPEIKAKRRMKRNVQKKQKRKEETQKRILRKGKARVSRGSFSLNHDNQSEI
ncbi:hypothetical protein NDN08_007893 [Rhodosorus marinus]|uniref:HEAT repeat-containing protein 1 n=1 Tax=Rhodosorus marinus TaxID=101924 RepID=A0AAV8UYU5_9RHOD|nr:hypothetical protein NDN08_007893 [Rhodosorus marinus]